MNRSELSVGSSVKLLAPKTDEEKENFAGGWIENEMGDVVEEIWVVTSIIEEVEGAVEVAPQLNCSRQDTWFWDVRYLEAA
jgi:hypothetical protein